MTKSKESSEEPLRDSPPSFENVLTELGLPGRFQVTQIAIVLLCVTNGNMMTMSYFFQGYVPPHVCNTVNESDIFTRYNLENDTTAKVTYKSCDLTVTTNRSGEIEDIATVSCPNGRNFSSDVNRASWISDWDLVCESKGRAEMTFSVFTMGHIFGGIIGSLVSDKFGRKPVLLVVCLGAVLQEIAIIFAPSIYVIIVMKFGSGFCQKAMSTCGFVYAMEYVAPKHRQIYGPISGLNWTLDVIIMGGIAYVLKDSPWQYLQIAICGTGVSILLGPFCLSESPRWLAANGRTDEALNILQKACKQNGKDFQRIKQLFNTYVDHTFGSAHREAMIPLNEVNSNGKCNVYSDSDTTIKKEDISILTLFKHKCLITPTIIMAFIWLVHVLTYYGLFMTASNLAGDRFVNFILMILVEIPSHLFVGIMLRKFGRRFMIALCLTITATCLTASTLCSTLASDLPWSATFTTVLFIVGKWGLSSSFSVIYITTPELFPTNLRSTASGFCNSIARVGSMVAPFMAMFYDVINWGPCLLFTALCIVASILVMFLSETKGQDLPNTLQELKDFSNRKGNNDFLKTTTQA